MRKTPTIEPMPAALTTRFEGVQALRGVAALLVVATHATFYASERLDPAFDVWNYGTIGVEIFFVISGFVMVISVRGLIGQPDAWRFFMMRRLVRIVPMYWLATSVKVAALLLAPAVVLHADLHLGRVLASYFFLPTRNPDGRAEPLLGVGWTLIFEMFFYVVFAAALALRAHVLYFVGAIMTACSLAFLWRPTSDWPIYTYYLDPIVLHFLVGMVIGYFALDRSWRRLAMGLAYCWGLYAAIVLLGPVGGWGIYRNGVLRMLVATMLVLAAVVFARACQRLPAVLSKLGDASYSLYLFHPILAPAIPVVMLKLGIISGPTSVALTLLTTPVAAWLIFVLAERKVTTQLQRRLPYVRGRRPVGAVTAAQHTEP